MNKSLVLVKTTVGSEVQADALASNLIKERLAACVQVAGPVNSFYEWKGRVCQEVEWQLWIKTRRDRFADVSGWLGDHHPYDEPELISVEICEASPGYKDWVVSQTADKRRS